MPADAGIQGHKRRGSWLLGSCFRRSTAVLMLASAGCAAQPAGTGTGTGGVVSTNPCADQLLLALAPDRVAAISHYSQAAGENTVPLDVARRYRATAGTAEEVIALKPDLVLASTFEPATTLAAYRRLGLKVLTLTSPTTIAASRDQVRQVAAALGRRPAGEALVARIDAAVAAADPCSPGPFALSLSKGGSIAAKGASTSSARTACGGYRPRALLFIAGSFANGGSTLLSEMLARAGFGDGAAVLGLTMSGQVPIERLMVQPPAVMLAPDPDARAARSRRGVLAAAGLRVAEAGFPRSLVNCGGPTIIPAMARLAAIRREVMR